MLQNYLGGDVAMILKICFIGSDNPADGHAAGGQEEKVTRIQYTLHSARITIYPAQNVPPIFL